MRRLITALLGALLLTACGTSRLDATVLDVSNQGEAYSYTFEPDTAWTLSYTWDCSTQRSQNASVETHFGMVLFNADDTSMAAEHPIVQRDGLKGTGSLHYTRSGAYYVHITSPCEYRIKAVKEMKS
jgi:hypothetical protein